MSTTPQTEDPWNTSSYQRIREAELIDQTLVVVFENMDSVEMPVMDFVPSELLDGSKLTVTNNRTEVVIHSDQSEYAIAWDNIRYHTDPAFAQEMQVKDQENSNMIAYRLQLMRIARKMRREDLATAAEIPLSTLVAIEEAHSRASLSTISKIVKAMGYSLKDFANYTSGDGTKT